MPFELGSTLRYDVKSPATLIFNIEVARNNWQQVLHEQIRVAPELPCDTYTMPESGNRYLRIRAPAGDLEIAYRARVALQAHHMEAGDIPEVPIEELPLDILTYLYPSRYCQSDLLLRFARHEFGDLLPGHARVAGICDWIHGNVEYLRGSSDSRTSAFDTATERAGVCRDFAHLGIAFCRALNIPARFVSGYAWQLDPPDFHAIFEAYLGDRWFLFDATRQVPLDGFVRIGTGRDAAEVSIASIMGTVQPTGMEVFITESGAVPQTVPNGEGEPALAVTTLPER